MKISLKGIEARNEYFKGVDYVADFVESTVGPYGLNHLLEKSNKFTNDGYNVSSEACGTVKNEFARRGAFNAHEACAKTNDMVGDATTTAWILNRALMKEGLRYLPNENTIKAKKTPAEIRKMIYKSRDFVISELEKSKKSVESKEELIKSALVSVEDEALAKMLGETQWELGPDGVIEVEETNAPICSIERVEGIKIDNGFGASHFVTNQEKQSIEIGEVPILLTNYIINEERMKFLKENVFTQLISSKKWGIVLVARAFDEKSIQMCQESLNSGFSIFPINAPYTDQNEIMLDIEAVVGGRYIANEMVAFEDIYVSDVGYCKKLEATSSKGFIAGIADEKALQRRTKRLEILKSKLAGETSDFYKKLLESRIAQFNNGCAILKVGSPSVIERKRLKDKCDDAVNAVRLALKGGTIKGAGLALKEIADKLEDDDILKRPLCRVNEAIMRYAPEDFVVEEWVRDPYLVIKCALENACEYAPNALALGGIITTEDPKTCSCSNPQLNDE